MDMGIHMSTPRNAKRHTPRVEDLEGRLCMATSAGWDGPGQGSAALTYYIGGAPSSLSQAAVNAAIRAALNVWSAVANITFTQTTQPNQLRSLDLTFRRIDGAGRTLAQGYFPADVNPARIAGDVQFDSSERWEVGNALGGAAFDLVSTAVHEIGHALGLDHTNVAGAVMAATISPNQSFSRLASSDVAAIRTLYAPRPTAASTATTTDEAAPTTVPAESFPRPRFPRAWRNRVGAGRVS
jgi:Matrixin